MESKESKSEWEEPVTLDGQHQFRITIWPWHFIITLLNWTKVNADISKRRKEQWELMTDKDKVEYVNTLRHEIHQAHFDKLNEVKTLTGIDYDELVALHKHRAMEIWHQQVRQWIDRNRHV